jgi:hypothetical protein
MIGPRSRRAIAVAFVLAAVAVGVAYAQTPSAAPVGNFGGGALAVPVDEHTVAKDMVLSMRAQSGGRLGVDGQLYTRCGLATINGDAKLAAGGSFTSRGAAKTKPVVGVTETSTFVVKGRLPADGGTGTAHATLRVRVKRHAIRTCSSSTVSWTVRRAAGAAAAPAPAPAESLLYGLTSQSGPHAKRAIVLHTTSGGRSIDRVVVGYRAKCDRGRVVVIDEVNYSPEFDVTPTGSFRHVETFKVPFTDVIANTTVVMRGQFYQGAGAAGKLSVTERFTSRKTGKRVDVCATGTLTWAAGP